MFCIHCGKAVLDGAQFCAYCGKPINQIDTEVTNAAQEPTKTKWEYNLYRATWKMGKGGRFNLLLGATEYGARLDNWGSDQSWILPEIQSWKDKGWEVVGDVGPGNYYFRWHDAYAGSIKYHWLEVYAFVVELRRPAKPRTEMEKRLIGVWQEPGNPKKGILRRPAKNIQVIFYENLKFEVYDRDGNLSDRGVFFTDRNNELQIRFKFTSEKDGKLTIDGNKLLLTRHGKAYRNMEYVRVDE